MLKVIRKKEKQITIEDLISRIREKRKFTEVILEDEIKLYRLSKVPTYGWSFNEIGQPINSYISGKLKVILHNVDINNLKVFTNKNEYIDFLKENWEG